MTTDFRYIRPLLFFSALLLLIPGLSRSQHDKNKALFVIVDGISYEQLKRVATPNLDHIAKTGGISRAYVGGEKKTYSQTPTISAVGYNSLLTGTWVNKHNVWDNSIKKPNYNYRTIFSFFQEAYPAKKTAVFSTWLDNRTKLIGTDLPETGRLQMGYYFDGFELDTINFPHDKKSDYISRIDDKVTDEAAAYIREQGPDLSWVYLQYTDDMGHAYGNSDPFFKAVSKMDTQMGKLWEAVKEREKNNGEKWQLFITTDHGRSEPAGKDHGGQSDAERSTWIITNAQGLNSYFLDSDKNPTVPGIVDILPTLVRHLHIPVPKDQAFELDGIPLTGALSVTNPALKREGDKLHVRWNAYEKDGNVKIWLTPTNHFEEGGRDRYLLMDEVPVNQEQAVLNIAALPKGFYKVVLEAKHNTVNRWLVEK